MKTNFLNRKNERWVSLRIFKWKLNIFGRCLKNEKKKEQ